MVEITFFKAGKLKTENKREKNYGRFLLKTPNLFIQNMCDVTTTIIICKKQMLLQSR